MRGYYTVNTEKKTSKSSITVALYAKTDNEIDWNQQFGVFWTVAYTKKKSETHYVYWDPNAYRWIHKSWKHKKSATASAALRSNFAGIKFDKKSVWELVETPKAIGKEIFIRAKRQFDQKDTKKFFFFKNSERDFHLHTKKEWKVGY